jgi:hypothetical protein
MASKIYWGAIRTNRTEGGTDYDFPMTEGQRRKAFLNKVRFFFYGASLFWFIGVAMGYAWRMAQLQ